jgi:hypothetical protein
MSQQLTTLRLSEGFFAHEKSETVAPEGIGQAFVRIPGRLREA